MIDNGTVVRYFLSILVLIGKGFQLGLGGPRGGLTHLDDSTVRRSYNWGGDRESLPDSTTVVV